MALILQLLVLTWPFLCLFPPGFLLTASLMCVTGIWWKVLFIMASSTYTIQISGELVNHLANDSAKLKKKTRKPKAKVQQASKAPRTSSPKSSPVDGWPLQPPVFVPVPAQQSASAELAAIRSVLLESEKVVERLQRQEESMLQEVTQRAKDLHDKEFKLPNQRPMPCLEMYNACLKCYRENLQDPLKCEAPVKDFADCARKVRQLVSSVDK